MIIEFEHLYYTTYGCSFFIHSISEKQYSVKSCNYVAFSHFHGCAVNNPGLILLSIEMSLKITGDEELSINEVAEKVPNLTVDEIQSVWYEYKKNKDNKVQ